MTRFLDEVQSDKGFNGSITALGTLSLNLSGTGSSAIVEAASAATDLLTIAFPVSVGADGDTVSVNLTTAEDDTLAVSESAEVITIALADTTATKNTAALIQAAIRALSTTTAGVDVSAITCTAGGDWDTAAIATGETGAVAFSGFDAVDSGTLTDEISLANVIRITSASGASDVIVTPTDGKLYIVQNTSGQAITLKASGQTGIAVATAKSAILMGNGTDIIRVTADA